MAQPEALSLSGRRVAFKLPQTTARCSGKGYGGRTVSAAGHTPDLSTHHRHPAPPLLLFPSSPTRSCVHEIEEARQWGARLINLVKRWSPDHVPGDPDWDERTLGMVDLSGKGATGKIYSSSSFTMPGPLAMMEPAASETVQGPRPTTRWCSEQGLDPTMERKAEEGKGQDGRSSTDSVVDGWTAVGWAWCLPGRGVEVGAWRQEVGRRLPAGSGRGFFSSERERVDQDGQVRGGLAGVLAMGINLPLWQFFSNIV